MEKTDILEADPAKFETLVELIRYLRGSMVAPRDKEQTHLSMRDSMLQECYEALEAVDENNTAKLCEELGDLLCQIVFQAQIAAENGAFDIDDVISSITTKLIRRHPHIFGNTEVENSKEVLANWEKIKREERGRERVKFLQYPGGIAGSGL